MRRTLALLALLATSWPHVVVLECALASSASTAGTSTDDVGAPAHTRAHHRGAGHRHDPGPRAAAEEGVPVGGQECAMVMACGLVMLHAEPATTSAVRASAPGAGSFTPPDASTTADLVADPPPPRRHA